MPNEMTPLEAAEIIERGDCGQRRYDAEDMAIRLLRAIAAGEYKPVVHAHWRHYKRSYIIPYDGIDEYQCSNCGCRRSARSKYCKDCGAVMDGKEDKNETNL